VPKEYRTSRLDTDCSPIYVLEISFRYHHLFR
jgi:hypothetical protein